MKHPWTREGQLTSIARASRVKAFGGESAVAKREADLTTLAQVTARLKPQPPQYDAFASSAAAKKAWAQAQAVSSQIDKAMHDFMSAPSRLGKSALTSGAATSGTLTLAKIKHAAAVMDRNNRPNGMVVIDDIIEFVGPPTKREVLSRVTARLKPPAPVWPTSDGHPDALRYAYGFSVSKPDAVVKIAYA